LLDTSISSTAIPAVNVDLPENVVVHANVPTSNVVMLALATVAVHDTVKSSVTVPPLTVTLPLIAVLPVIVGIVALVTVALAIVALPVTFKSLVLARLPTSKSS